MTECINCNNETDNENCVMIKDANGNPSPLCKDCLCYNCETNLAESHDNIEIDENNWVRVKVPNYPSNWVFSTPEELNKMLEVYIELVCDCCKNYYCKKCDTLCINYCTECYSTCNECECTK